ncbi:MAG TPA: hypothetical protein VEO91_13515 [Candidatus Limnocylindria bacterium]|nr:hypothetical protein [Candidatus Limnocylindria bacterium]
MASREPLPFCGQEPSSSGIDFNLPARQCFWDAYQRRRPAEFITTKSTIEGDPVTMIYRVRRDGRIEVFVDATQDQYSARLWSRLDCPTLSRADDAIQPAFGPGDCRETFFH